MPTEMIFYAKIAARYGVDPTDSAAVDQFYLTGMDELSVSEQASICQELLDLDGAQYSQLLWIVPQNMASDAPTIDYLTIQFDSAAYRSSEITNPPGIREGDRCICGAEASNTNYELEGFQVKSLALHYLTWHRSEIPRTELDKIVSLPIALPALGKFDIWHTNPPPAWVNKTYKERVSAKEKEMYKVTHTYNGKIVLISPAMSYSSAVAYKKAWENTKAPEVVDELKIVSLAEATKIRLGDSQ